MSTNAAVAHDDGLIRFEFNVPVRVALKYAEGKPIEGRYGESLLFSTTDGRRFFIPAPVGEQITALGIRPGEPISITKVEGKVGRRRIASYEIERASGAAPAAAPSPAPRPGPVMMPAPAAGPASASPSAEPSIRRYLYDNYKVAVDVLVEVEKYSKARGLAVEFTAEDVRTLAATVLIQKGGSAWPR